MLKNINASWKYKREAGIAPEIDLLVAMIPVVLGYIIHWGVGIWAFYLGMIIGGLYMGKSLALDNHMGRILLEEGEDAMWRDYDGS